MADDFFDHPEVGQQEFHAFETLTVWLEKKKASLWSAALLVWTPRSGLSGSTARAAQTSACSASTTLWPVWATPAATICRGPAILGAAKALKDAAIDAPYTITVYGTPAEETISGKVVMLENGCTFEELDVALMMHGGPATQVDVKSLALNKLKIIYHGVCSHAALKPEKGPQRTGRPDSRPVRASSSCGACSLGCSDALHHRQLRRHGGKCGARLCRSSMYVRSYNRTELGRRGGPRQEGTCRAQP